MEKPNLDLRLIKKMIAQLEEQLAVAEEVRQGIDLSSPSNKEVFNTFMIEMSKVHGILAYISKESLDLTKDIVNVLRYAGVPSEMSDLNSILNNLIPPASSEGNGGKFNN